ncbi:MAG: helix-turn-helix domain-containing protein [Planctomycetaceae bacterium]
MTEESRHDESLLTLKEVADYLRVSEDSIYKMAQAGEIPGFKIGRQWRFRRSEIHDWLHQQSNQRTAKFETAPPDAKHETERRVR